MPVIGSGTIGITSGSSPSAIVPASGQHCNLRAKVTIVSVHYQGVFIGMHKTLDRRRSQTILLIGRPIKKSTPDNVYDACCYGEHVVNFFLQHYALSRLRRVAEHIGKHATLLTTLTRGMPGCLECGKSDGNHLAG